MSEAARQRPGLALLAEAGAFMLAASLAIRFVPFQRLAKALGRELEHRPAKPEEIASILHSIRAWSRRLPWRTLCFEEGLSAHWMLRRRCLASTLFYGAATIDGELKAHVWVRSRDRDVIGCEAARNYAVLARFPAT